MTELSGKAAWIAAAGGIVIGACFLPGGPGWLIAAAFVPLLWLAVERTPGRAFLLGWLTGFCGWIVGVHWMAASLARFLGLSWPAALGLHLFYCAAHGIMFGLWAAAVSAWTQPLARRLGGRPYAAAALVAVPALVCLEGYFPQQFPLRFAMTLFASLPQLQINEWLGPAGTAWLVGGFNAAAYAAAHSARSGRARWKPLAAMILLASANHAYGTRRMRALASDGEKRTLHAGIVQAAVPIDAKQRPESFAGNLAAHGALTRKLLAEGPLDLIVWPETSYERPVRYRREGGLPKDPTIEGAPMQAFLKKELPYEAPLLLSAIGEVETPERVRKYNTVFLTGASREFLGLVEKRRLLPLGEYMPFGRYLPWLRRVSPRTWRLSRGGAARLLTTPSGARFGVLICYEAVLAEVGRDYARLGAELLVNVSNDGWFSPMGAEQHLRSSALRTIETRRWMLRAVNSGVSAVIDPSGRITRRLDFGAEGVLSASVPLRDEITLYARIGDLFYRLGAALLMLSVALASTSKGPRSR